MQYEVLLRVAMFITASIIDRVTLEILLTNYEFFGRILSLLLHPKIATAHGSRTHESVQPQYSKCTPT